MGSSIFMFILKYARIESNVVKYNKNTILLIHDKKFY